MPIVKAAIKTARMPPNKKKLPERSTALPNDPSSSPTSVILSPGCSIFSSLNFSSSMFLFSPKNPDSEKLSAYECGFEAFGDSRMKFDVRFYLVAILFIIFDLEIAFLFPWAISLGNIGALGFWSMMIFLFVLTIGFVYEWKKGALDWD